MEHAEQAAKIEEGPCASGIRRDREFWFDDGTITLIAGSVEFRVYKGLLARRSPVFADMFSLPQPGISEAEDGGPPMLQSAATPPVVHLADSPEAFRLLLRVIMAPDDDAPMPLFDDIHPACFTVASCIRLGHKYQMDRLVSRCVKYLERNLPMSFDKLEDFNTPEDFLPPGFEGNIAYSICVINLARLTGAAHLLPVPSLICACAVAKRTLLEDTLSPADLARCLEAESELSRARMRSVRICLTSLPCNDCLRSENCTVVIRRQLWDVIEEVAPYPFASMTHMMTDLCGNCWETLRSLEKLERQELWNALPYLVGLGPIKGWNEERASE